MKIRSIFRACAVVAAVSLAGCSPSNPPESTVARDMADKKATALKVTRDNPCSVLLPTEVGEILGAKAEMREVVDEVTCRYHFQPPAQRKTTTGEETFIEVKVHWTDGQTAVTATRLAGQLLGGGGESAFEKLKGIGDEAWLAPMASYLSFAKGDVGVEIDMRMMPGEKEKAIRLAKLIESRI